MSAEREVIREFLVSLGFHIEPVGARRFAEVLMGSSKMAGKAAAVIVSVGAAAEAMVLGFSRSMEKLHYASKRNQSTVDSLQAIQFAFEQIGLDGDEALSMLEGFTQGLRTNPGLMALLNNLGVKTEGRDRVQVLYDLVEQLAKMPHFVGAQWAQQFGLSEQAFLQMKQHLPELRAADEKRREMNRQANMDTQRSAAIAKEYMNILRELWERVKILGQMVSDKMLPAFYQLNSVINLILSDLMEWTSSGFSIELGEWGEQIRSIVTELGKLKEMLTSTNEANWLNSFFWIIKTEAKGAAHALLDLTDGVLALGTGNVVKAVGKFKSVLKFIAFGPQQDAKKAEEEDRRIRAGVRSGAPGEMVQGSIRRAFAPVASGQPADAGDLFSRLEQVYGLPAGLLDKMWAKESNRGKNMLSPAGAMGHFQFMPRTAKQYGLEDPNNLRQAASAAAEYMHDLMQKYGGDLNKALAAYNWGPGNVDKHGLGRMPAETRDYVNTIGKSVTLNQTNNIVVHGTDAASTARAVGNEQTRVASDIVRNTAGAVR